MVAHEFGLYLQSIIWTVRRISLYGFPKSSGLSSVLSAQLAEVHRYSRILIQQYNH